MKTNLKTTLVTPTNFESIFNSKNQTVKTLWQNSVLDFLTQKTFKMKTKTVFTVFFALFICLTFSQLSAQKTEYSSQYFNFPNEEYDIRAIISTPDEGTAFTGTRLKVNYYNNEIVEFNGIYVSRTDSTGKAKWMKFFHIDNGENCFVEPTTIANTEDEGFIVGGIVSDCSGFSVGMFLLKIDRDGYVNWLKFYHNQTHVALKEIEPDGYGGFVGVATVFRQNYEDNFGTTVFIFDDAGNIANQKLFESSDSDLEAKAIEVYPDNGFAVLVEHIHDGVNGVTSNPLVIKLDDHLNEQWNRHINHSLAEITARDIAIGIYGDILITGNVNLYQPTENMIYLISLKPTGNLNWDNTFHWRDCEFIDQLSAETVGLTVDQSGNIYIGGNDWNRLHEESANPGNLNFSNDAFVIQTTLGGAAQWVNFYGREFTENMMTMASRNGDGFVLGGYFYDQINPGNLYGWAVKGDAHGNSECDFDRGIVQSINCDYTVNPIGLEKPNVDLNELIIGAEADAQTFIAYVCYEFKTTGYSEMPLIDNSEIQKDDLQLKLTPAVFPNPTEGKFNIKMPENWDGETLTHVTILDTTGKVILKKEIADFDTEFDMTNLAKGAYFVKIKTGEQFSQHKLIIQ